MSETLLHHRDVEARTGLARSTIYKWISEGGFPSPVRLGGRVVAWRASEIEAWIEAQTEARAA